MATKRSKTDVNNDEAVVNKCLATKNKKQQKSIESKIRIIEAAKAEFTSHGFDAARIDEIGHFKYGSTVIVLWANGKGDLPYDLAVGTPVKFGRSLIV